jgi:hypothetical protein
LQPIAMRRAEARRVLRALPPEGVNMESPDTGRKARTEQPADLPGIDA